MRSGASHVASSAVRELDAREIVVIPHAQVALDAEAPQRGFRHARPAEARARDLVPYGRREERQGDDGCCHVGMPSAVDRASRMSCLVNPSSASGLGDAVLARRCAPGR